MKRIILILIAYISIAIPGLAQPLLDTCLVYGYVYKPDMSPAAGAIIQTRRIVKSGPLWSQASISDTADASGYIEIVLPRNCIAYLYGPVHGLSQYPGVGTPLTIPDTNIISLGSLVTAVNVPSTYVIAVTNESGGIDGSGAIGRLPKFSSTTSLTSSSFAEDAGNLRMDGGKITRLAPGSSDSDAVIKAQLDAQELKRDTTGDFERGMVESDLALHIGNTSNPHSVTASQVGAVTPSIVNDSLRMLANGGSYDIVPDAIKAGTDYQILTSVSGVAQWAAMPPVTLPDSLVLSGIITRYRPGDWLLLEADSMMYRILDMSYADSVPIWGNQGEGYITFELRFNLGAYSSTAHLAGIRLYADTAHGIRIDEVNYQVWGVVDTGLATRRTSFINYTWGAPASFPGLWITTSTLNNSANAGVVAVQEPYAIPTHGQFAFFHGKNNGTRGWGILRVHYVRYSGNKSTIPIKLAETD